MSSSNPETQEQREARNLNAALLHWVLGAAILPAGAVTYYFIFHGISQQELPNDFVWQVTQLALLLSIPGLVYICLGFFHLFRYKYVEPLTLKGVGVTALQLIPGLFVSIFTPTTPVMPGWLPIALGAAVSLIVVRTVRKH